MAGHCHPRSEPTRVFAVGAPTPLEATVSLDGAVVGPGPRTIEPVGAGEHTIEVSLDGYATDRRTVTVEPDEVLRVDVALAPVQAAPSRRLPWGRLVLDVTTTGAGGVLAGHALYVYGQARLAYADFLSVEDNTEAEAIYQDEVAPRRRQAIAEGASAALALAGSALLWAKTDFRVQPTPTGFAVVGRW
ncbi:MAG: PEGA domain-containing protein [Pseudomonadota bacterium]